MSVQQKKFIGAYLEVSDVLHYGVPEALRTFGEEAHVFNLFFRSSFTGGNDHGGAIWKPDPQYYSDTKLSLEEFSRKSASDPAGSGDAGNPLPGHPGSGGQDLLGEVCQEAEKWDMGIFLYLFPAKGPLHGFSNYQEIMERDPDGREGLGACWNNPDFHALLVGAAEDVVRNYPVKGILWGAERCGPLGWQILKAGKKPASFCFCPHCLAIGRQIGIDVERAKTGWRRIVQLFEAVASGNRPTDGCFVSFWRLLLAYPEILQWEKLWWDGKRRIQRDIYQTVKRIDPVRRMGYHLWHRGRGFSPFYRAAVDIAELASIGDFVKPAIFTNPAGYRFKEQVEGLSHTIFGDLEADQIGAMLYQVLGYDEEGPLTDIPRTGFSSKYVYRETKAIVDRASGKIKVYAGIGAATYGSPNGRYPDVKKAEEKDIVTDLEAAVHAGADGVIFGNVGLDEGLAKALHKATQNVGWT